MDCLACPHDGESLAADTPGALRCAACQAVYPLVDGIPSFVPAAVDQPSEQAKRDEEAVVYDRLFTVAHNFIEIPPIVGEMRLGPRDRVLDLGVGTGRVLREYAPACERVVAVDFSLESLRTLRRSLPPPLRERVLLVQADICRPPVARAQFSRILCSQVLHHLPTAAHRAQAVAAMRAALRPGGVAVLTAYHWNVARRLAARFSKEAPGVGNRREGYHSDGQIFFHNLAPGEMRQLLAPHFRVERLFGLLQRIRGLHRLGVCRPVVERLIERTPLSLWAGQLLVARAVKPDR